MMLVSTPHDVVIQVVMKWSKIVIILFDDNSVINQLLY